MLNASQFAPRLNSQAPDLHAEIRALAAAFAMGAAARIAAAPNPDAEASAIASQIAVAERLSMASVTPALAVARRIGPLSGAAPSADAERMGRGFPSLSARRRRPPPAYTRLKRRRAMRRKRLLCATAAAGRCAEYARQGQGLEQEPGGDRCGRRDCGLLLYQTSAAARSTTTDRQSGPTL